MKKFIIIFFKSLFSELKEIHSSGSSLSSKRFYGAIGFLCSIVFIAVWQHNLINELLFTSAALLGLGILDKINKK